ncbi:MAG TPA: DUF523 domain-containing protein [Vicinamibacterales bacterium]|nr:DUF523 domain-containing protein [Vicinamibacterales bacterium]
MADRPRIGVSACLVGQRVRYDGGDKRDAWLVDVLGPQVEWVTVCPEVEAGLGTPREPMNLGRDATGRIVLITDRVRDDLTAAMIDFSAERVAELAAADLDGYVLKAGSPSCGLDVPVQGGGPQRGRGLFAAALTAAVPNLPVADERELAEPAARDRFVARVHAHHRRRTMAQR